MLVRGKVLILVLTNSILLPGKLQKKAEYCSVIYALPQILTTADYLHRCSPLPNDLSVK